MTANVSGSSDFTGTAKIYTFPARGRFAAGHAKPDAAAHVQLPRGAKLAGCAGSSYHAAAIEDAKSEPGRKN